MLKSQAHLLDHAPDVITSIYWPYLKHSIAFYKNADGIIISYDVTDRKTFESIKTWVDSIDTHGKKTAARILVGNKIDLER